MYSIRRLIVGLDLTKMDVHLVKYTFFLTKVIKTVDKIFFVHIASNNNELPEELKGQYPEITSASQEAIVQNMKKLIAEYDYQDTEHPFEVIVKSTQGDPLTQILLLSKKHQVDLVVTGRKNVMDGSGLLARKLARRALCSVLSVPENVRTNISKIFIPVDFSDYSEAALEYALRIAKTNSSKEVKIVCHHVYRLPNGYYASGKSEEEFGEIMEKNADEIWYNFVKPFDIDPNQVTIKYAFDPKGSALARTSYSNALVEHADMVLLGSKGRTRAAAALLGSFAEKLLIQNNSIPLLVLKSKKKNLGMLSALMKI